MELVPRLCRIFSAGNVSTYVYFASYDRLVYTGRPGWSINFILGHSVTVTQTGGTNKGARSSQSSPLSYLMFNIYGRS